jgi:hypothetical protein
MLWLIFFIFSCWFQIWYLQKHPSSPLGGLTPLGPAPPPVFGSKIVQIPPPNVAVVIQHPGPKISKMITRLGVGFESRRCQKNFTIKTFFAILKNVKYRSVAYPWPKLWAFWVLLLSYNCTTIRRNWVSIM